MLALSPAYLFFLKHRLPTGGLRGGWQSWLSIMGTNAAIAILVAKMIWLVGVGPFLLVHLPIALLASSIGVWLFYVQHQFEGTFWVDDEGWSFREAAVRGSSHYDLPVILRWFTANIGATWSLEASTMSWPSVSAIGFIGQRAVNEPLN